MEPNPEVYPILRRNLNRFPQALALQLAASTVQGPVVLQVPKRITGVPELQPHLLRKALRIPSVSMWWRPNLSTPSCLSCTCKGWTSSKSMLKEQRWISFAPWVMPWKRSMRSFASCFHPTFRPLGNPREFAGGFVLRGFRRFAIIDLHVDGRLQTKPWLWLSAAEVMGLVATLPPDFGANLVARR